MAPRPQHCSFCGKKQSEVKRLFGEIRLAALICNECIESAVFQMHQDGIEPFCHMIQPNVLPFRRRE